MGVLQCTVVMRRGHSSVQRDSGPLGTSKKMTQTDEYCFQKLFPSPEMQTKMKQYHAVVTKRSHSTCLPTQVHQWYNIKIYTAPPPPFYCPYSRRACVRGFPFSFRPLDTLEKKLRISSTHFLRYYELTLSDVCIHTHLIQLRTVHPDF